MVSTLESLGPGDPVQKLLVRLIGAPRTEAGGKSQQRRERLRRAALETLRRLRPKKVHPGIPAALERALATNNAAQQRAVIRTASEIELPVEASVGLRRER